jgi:4-hydroxy-3-methylbut-2-enyl diphosphate reductase
MGAAYDWPVRVAGKYPQGMASTINMGIPGATASIVERTVGKRVLLAEPRGYCAGVDRAVETVERALEKHGAPVYVRHEIVHNVHVVETLAKAGAIFVEETDEVPEGSIVVFSAHGVAPTVHVDAAARNLRTIDATCPLVTKVHREAQVHHKRGRHIILIGHAGHPEVIGTMGQLPQGAATLVETVDDIARLQPADPDNLAFVTQTTLSVDDTQDMVEALKARFSSIVGPHKEDICYATTNRQGAVKRVAPQVDAMIVVGSPNSSNSQRLREVAEREGCPLVRLILRAEDIDWSLFGNVRSLGITAGASAPEILVEEIIDAFAARYEVSVESVSTADESVFFPLPRELREQAAE